MFVHKLVYISLRFTNCKGKQNLQKTTAVKLVKKFYKFYSNAKVYVMFNFVKLSINIYRMLRSNVF